MEPLVAAGVFSLGTLVAGPKYALTHAGPDILSDRASLPANGMGHAYFFA
jgi:hypothetical protein